MRNENDRLLDILEAIAAIQDRLPAGRDAFDADPLIQIWVIYHLTIIGEAARHLSDSTRGQAPDVPWKQIVGMRHVLVHGYFGIDPDAVWSAATGDLRALKAAIETIVKR